LERGQGGHECWALAQVALVLGLEKAEALGHVLAEALGAAAAEMEHELVPVRAEATCCPA